MGMGLLGRSFSTFDRKDYGTVITEVPKLPNPDPNNYVILSHTHINGHLIVKIKYPDCTNYEGNKILLFEDTNIRELKEQKVIDPHFSRNKKYKSPIARFEPTGKGWRLAEVTAMSMIYGGHNE